MIRFPFSPKPKPEGEPLYADIYGRALASGLDVFLLFTGLKPLFEQVANRAFSHVNWMMLNTMPEEPSVGDVIRVFTQSGFVAAWIGNSLMQLAMMCVLLTAMYILIGNTPGKWLLGLRIVRASDLQPIGAFRYFLRLFTYIPAVLPLMIGVFWISFNKRHRGWHDMLAGTVVLNTRGYGWYKENAKYLWRKVRGSKPVSAVEEPVGDPAADERHEDRG